MNRIRVICAAGAQPNFIKIAPLMAAMAGNSAFVKRLSCFLVEPVGQPTIAVGKPSCARCSSHSIGSG